MMQKKRCENCNKKLKINIILCCPCGCFCSLNCYKIRHLELEENLKHQNL